jgi:tRNA threonylcarbamoyladenosine biosynthesis protein TsaB
MITLFIDTHYKDIIVALFKDNTIIDKKIIINAKSTSVETMPTIINLLTDNKLNIKDVNRIAVDKGPGSFTGIRIGVTLAKVISYSLNIPILSITSIQIMSLGHTFNGYYSVLENNGAFVAKDDDLNNILYFKKGEYLKFKENNNVLENTDIDFLSLINYITNMKPENSFNVNPVYIKNIEVLHDSKN